MRLPATLSLSLSLSLVVGADRAFAQAGQWSPPYNWNMSSPTGPGQQVINVIHAGLISRGLQKGKVVFLTWDRPTAGSPPGAYWGILDPDLQAGTLPPPAATFTHMAQLTAGALEFNHDEATCVGQSWTPDGRWFIAGGQVPLAGGPASHDVSAAPAQAFGSRGAWIYDPDVQSLASGAPAVGAWFAEPAMEKRRYYPAVILSQIDTVLAPRGEMIVAGGSDDWWTGPWQPPQLYQDSYEVFHPGARAWPGYLGGTWQTRTVSPGVTSRLFPGPTVTGIGGVSPRFLWYPRLFLLPNGRMFCAGTEPQSSIAQHPTSSAASWTNLDVRTTPQVYGYGTALLYPNYSAVHANTVVNVGAFDVSGPTTRVEWAHAAALATGNWPAGYDWTAAPTATSLPALNHPRSECNSVILPTGDVMVIGDGTEPPATPVRTPEVLQGGVWTVLPAEASVRDHHAVTLLLPSGKVLSAGGNRRTYDFQVFSPSYMGKPRPVWGAPPGGGILNRAQTYSVPITMPAGERLGRVVLIRPGSITHHGDMDQRYVQLELDSDGDGVTTAMFRAPDGPPAPAAGVRAPLGYYMAFLVTQGGVPSVAEFVRFQ